MILVVKMKSNIEEKFLPIMDVQDFYSFYYLFLGGTNILASNFMDLYQMIFSFQKKKLLTFDSFMLCKCR